MLDLDDPRWTDLAHAYGSAADIPQLLKSAAERPGQAGPNDEPWFTLWSSLCHQGDVYTASYAAIPHIVDIALSARGPIDFSFLLLPASIDVARAGGKGPGMPAFLVSAYEEAIRRLPECVNAHRVESWSQDMTIAATAALAVSKGHHDFAEAVISLDPDLISRINRGDLDWVVR